jgi:hypothetical protein
MFENTLTNLESCRVAVAFASGMIVIYVKLLPIPLIYLDFAQTKGNMLPGEDKDETFT